MTPQAFAKSDGYDSPRATVRPVDTYPPTPEFRPQSGSQWQPHPQAEQQLYDLHTRLRDCTQENVALRSSLAAQQQANVDLQQRLKLAMNHMAEAMFAADKQVREQQATITDQQATIKDHLSTIDDQKSTIDHQQSTITSQESELANLRLQNAKTASDNQAIRGQLKKATSTGFDNGMSTQLEKQKSIVGKLDRECETLRAYATQLQNRLKFQPQLISDLTYINDRMRTVTASNVNDIAINCRFIVQRNLDALQNNLQKENEAEVAAVRVNERWNAKKQGSHRGHVARGQDAGALEPSLA